jgi:hypothetical protein
MAIRFGAARKKWITSSRPSAFEMSEEYFVVSRRKRRQGNVGCCPPVEAMETWLDEDEEEEEREEVGAKEVEGRKRLQQSAGSKHRFNSTSDSYVRHRRCFPLKTLCQTELLHTLEDARSSRRPPSRRAEPQTLMVSSRSFGMRESKSEYENLNARSQTWWSVEYFRW